MSLTIRFLFGCSDSYTDAENLSNLFDKEDAAGPFSTDGGGHLEMLGREFEACVHEETAGECAALEGQGRLGSVAVDLADAVGRGGVEALQTHSREADTLEICEPPPEKDCAIFF